MKERILLIGEDALLLETRAMILAEWRTVKSNLSEFQWHAGVTFDLVILCHSVPLEAAKKLVAQVQQMAEPPAVLAIRRHDQPGELGVRVHFADICENPGWISAEVAEILKGRKAETQSVGPVTPFPATGLPGVGQLN